MVINEELTVTNLTPPGYFNLASGAPSTHTAYIAWWNNILSRRATQSIALKTLILTPWLVDHLDSPRTPWLDYLLEQYGFGFFGGTNNQAAAIYKLASHGWNRSTTKNILLILQTLCLAPFSWFDNTYLPHVIAGNLLPSITDTGFIVYSTAASAPATPSPSAYVARGWAAPSHWTKTASSATYYSRGYISGTNLVWIAPRPVADFLNPVLFLATSPIQEEITPTAGTLCIVENDGTGDHGSVYYADNLTWRKCSCPNADLGMVSTTGSRPTPEAITVLAPNPASVTYAIDSAVPPPVDGSTEGYGTFSTWSSTAIMTNEITIQLKQIAGGSIAIATLFELLRRIIPTGKTFVIKIDDVKYYITDKRRIS